jgi:hypothetical protein
MIQSSEGYGTTRNDEYSLILEEYFKFKHAGVKNGEWLVIARAVLPVQLPAKDG